MKKVFIVICVAFLFACKKEPKLILNYTKGDAFGTTFSAQFIDHEKIDFSDQYDSIITLINSSMSTYQTDSDISKINKGDTTITVDDHFVTVFNIAKKIHKETQGAFDPTIGVLVNAWDFGPEGGVKRLDSLKIDSLLGSVGLNKIKLKNNKIIKEKKEAFLDFNALAKGYAVDVFANFLENKGVENYLVEIGGEIKAKGSNQVKDKSWRIGVEDPNFDQTQSYSKVISLENASMATSGSYRKYKVDQNGDRYAHIIDAKTGYPHKSKLLSVSVIANSCIEADAYATALMSMGLEGSKEFLVNHPELQAYFIFEDTSKNLRTMGVNGFPENK